MENKLKLNVKMTLFISIALITWGAFNEIYNSTLQNILVSKLGNSETFKGAIMSSLNVLGMLLFPLFAVMSDKSSNKLGKRTMFILVGGIGCAIFLIISLFFANSLSTLGYVIFIILAYLSICIYRPAALAILPDLTPKPLNSEANAIKGIILAAGGFFVTILILIFGENFTAIYLITAIIILLSLFIFKWKVNEKKLYDDNKELLDKYNKVTDSSHKEKFKISTMPKDKKISLYLLLLMTVFTFLGYQSMLSTYVNYSEVVWGMEYNKTSIFIILIGIGGLAATYPIAISAKKFGRKNVLIIGLVFMLVGFLIAIFMKDFGILTLIVFILLGIGWSVMSIISPPMILELSDVSTVGFFISIYTIATTIGKIIAPLLIGLLIDYSGFGYSILYPVASFFMILAIVTLFFVKKSNVNVQKFTSEKELKENT